MSAIALAVAASLTSAVLGASAASTGDVDDALTASLVGLGALVWAAVHAATRGYVGAGLPGWPGRAASMVTAAALVRLPWLVAPPVFSDDVYRYVWEGRVWAAGLNPLAYAPADLRLAALRDAAHHPSNAAIWAQVNHPELSSIYPPVAQMLFVLLAPGGVLAWKLVAAAADCGTVWLLGGRSARAGWLWALLPLTSLESAGSAHLESVGVLCMVAALSRGGQAGAERGGQAAAAWFGAMIKLLPVATLLPLLRTRRAWGVAVTATALAFLPLLAAGPDMLRGFQAYRLHWSFNGSAYPLLATGLDLGLGKSLPSWVPADPARGLLQLIGAGWVALAAWRARTDPGDHAAARLTVATTAAFVLLSPTVHPWYVLWPLAATLASERPANGDKSTAWVLAAVLIPLAYRVLDTLHDGVWQEDPRTRWVVWGPVWLAGWLTISRPSSLPGTS